MITTDTMRFKLNAIVSTNDSVSTAILCRELLSDCVEYVYNETGISIPPKATLIELLEHPLFYDYGLDQKRITGLNYVRRLGMIAEHEKRIKKKEADLAVEIICEFVGIILDKKPDEPKPDVSQVTHIEEVEALRIYIDIYLKEAGWEVLENKNVIQPCKAGTDMVIGDISGTQDSYICDRVLFGKDGKPLAIVVINKVSDEATDIRRRVKSCGEIMEKKYGHMPILYISNGYEIHIIDGIYPERRVMAFLTLKDLELMIQRRSRKDINYQNISSDIAGRPYQITAISKLCERFNAGKRRGLIVLATGELSFWKQDMRKLRRMIVRYKN